MKAAATLLQNRTVQIVLVVIIIIAIIYFIGRKSGKDAANAPSLFDFLNDEEKTPPAVNTVNGVEPTGNIQHITDDIYLSIDAHRWYSGNGAAINSAFVGFNAVPHEDKVAVVNDWNKRYFGTDKPLVFTGDYGTIKQELSLFVSAGLQPQVAIALRWMQDNKIN